MKSGGMFAMLIIVIYMLVAAFAFKLSSSGDLNTFFLRNQWALVLGVLAVLLVVLMILPTKQKESRTTTTEEVGYCIHCGGSIPVGAKFCKKCGKPQT